MLMGLQIGTLKPVLSYLEYSSHLIENIFSAVPFNCLQRCLGHLQHEVSKQWIIDKSQ